MGIVRQMGADIADGMTRNMELVGTKGGPHNQERNQKRVGSRLFGQTRDRLFWEPGTRMWTVGIRPGGTCECQNQVYLLYLLYLVSKYAFI